VWRKHGISDAKFQKLKARFGRLEVFETKRLGYRRLGVLLEREGVRLNHMA
jgi:hypothetical protein